MDVIDPNLRKPFSVIGVMAKYLEAREVVYVTGPSPVSLWLRPKDNDISAVLNPVPGGPESVIVVGAQVTVDFDPGVSTPVSLQAVVSALPAADALMAIDGGVTPIPATFVGGTWDLYLLRPIVPALMHVIDGDGDAVPFSGKSISIAVTVAPDRDNAYDCVSVDLGVARAAPGVEITKGGGSLVGRNLSVVSTGGDFDLKFNSNANDAIPQTVADHGAFEGTDFLKVFMTNIAQPGKTAVLYVGKKV